MHRLLLLAAATLCWAEVPASVLAEPDLEKRSELALKAVDDTITSASKAYASGEDPKAFEQHLATVEELTRLSLKSLNDTGKHASKKPKYFKRAELKLRSLLRRMSTLSSEVSVEDRARVETAIKTMTEVHEQLLHDIMSKR